MGKGKKKTNNSKYNSSNKAYQSVSNNSHYNTRLKKKERREKTECSIFDDKMNFPIFTLQRPIYLNTKFTFEYDHSSNNHDNITLDIIEYPNIHEDEDINLLDILTQTPNSNITVEYDKIPLTFKEDDIYTLEKFKERYYPKKKQIHQNNRSYASATYNSGKFNDDGFTPVLSKKQRKIVRKQQSNFNNPQQSIKRKMNFIDSLQNSQDSETEREIKKIIQNDINTLNIPNIKKNESDKFNIKIPQLSLHNENEIIFNESNLNINYRERYGIFNSKLSHLLAQIASSNIQISDEMDYYHNNLTTLINNNDIELTDSLIDTIMKINSQRWNDYMNIKQLEDINKDKSKELMGTYEIINKLYGDFRKKYNNLPNEIIDKIIKILQGLQFTNDEIYANYNQLNPNKKEIFNLALGLIVEPTLLLLDNPTNNLSIKAIIWLTDYLSNYPNSLLIYSNDINILQKSVNNILTIENDKLVYYQTNYNNYLIEYHQKMGQIDKEWTKLNTRIKNMRRGGKHQNRIEADKLMNMAIKQGLYKPKSNFIRIRFDEKPIIHSQNQSQSQDEECNLPIELENIKIQKDSRIIFCPEDEDIKLPFSQIVSKLTKYSNVKCLGISLFDDDDLNYNCKNYIQTKSLYSISNNKTRKILEDLELDYNLHNKKMTKFNDLEKIKVQIATIMVSYPDLIILDNPTVNMDLLLQKSLINALANKTCAIIGLTSDINLIRNLKTNIYTFKNNQFIDLKTDIDTYQKHILTIH